MTNTLSLPRTTNPIAEFLKDFDREFFHFNNMIDWTSDIPTLRNTMIDRTGFPRANIRNVSTKTEDRLEIVLALPGWNKENSKLDISIDQGILKVVGIIDKDTRNNTIKAEEKGENYGKEYERNTSLKETFAWSHTVTDDTEFESATLKDGLLEIIVKVPQPNKPKPKTITVG